MNETKKYVLVPGVEGKRVRVTLTPVKAGAVGKQISGTELHGWMNIKPEDAIVIRQDNGTVSAITARFVQSKEEVTE